MRTAEITTDIKNAMYDALVENCGASDDPDTRLSFIVHFPECREFRFMGALGFGGKVWANRGRYYVTCYKEDETPKRLAMIEGANADLGRWSDGRI